ncbi:MAG: arginase family protein [Bacteroidia bacterium]|nr:arginase family protein [Bacteroidia bacterium]
MDLSVFFQPIKKPHRLPDLQADPSLMDQVDCFIDEFPDWEMADVLFFSACIRDHQWLPSVFRQQFFSLSQPYPRAKIADLGHLKPRELVEDSLEQLSYVLAQLRKSGKPCIIVYDDPLLSMAQIHAFEGAESPIEYVHIDSQADQLDSDLLLDHQSYHHALLKTMPAWLFDYSLLGYQRYFVSEEQLNWLKERNLTAIRYGQLMGNIQEAEPYLRTAQVISVDLSAVRAADAPAAATLSSGGFSAEEFCRVARYAGLGYGPLSFSLSGWAPIDDRRDQTSRLSAMAAWYFLDGFYHRFDDYPREDKSNLTQYSVQLHSSIPKIDFYKHNRSERWWMEVPYQDSIGAKWPKTRLVACSEKDYEFSRNDDIPERWWTIYNKLSS